jgi:electron transfer flavoprotein beta subunit
VKIAVLIAGVHDPKWPVTPKGEQMPETDADRRIMSPFDEAALEMALRIRDAKGDARIAAYVAGGLAATKIARAVASLNITDVSVLDQDEPWDQAAMARTLAPLCTDADLILIGREFGDYDDGLVPALLAGVLRVPLFARAQTVEARGEVRLTREAESFAETLTLSDCAVASVTNDRRTRLRKPLMKNVMLARQASIGQIPARACRTVGLEIESMTVRSPDRGQTSCAMIGGSIEEQAQALAKLLREAQP